MKSFWGWISLFLFSIFMGAVSAKADIPQEVKRIRDERSLVNLPAFNDALNNNTRATNAVEDPADPKKNLEFCKTDKWAKTCLDLLISYRCTQYTFPFPGIGCIDAGADFVAALSMKKIDVKVKEDDGKVNTYNLPVIFTRDLEKVIENKAVQTYLETLLPLIVKHEKLNLRFNLYEYTLSKFNNNPILATGLLAVLFQDTSFVQIQAAYLEQMQAEKKVSPSATKAIQAMRYISEYLDYPNMDEVNKTHWFEMYPNIGTLNRDLNYSLYHFYPMAYTAMILKGDNGDRLGFFIPFLFNSDYEFQDLDPQMWPFNHPRPFKLTPQLDWKMKDIYAGLVGGMFGAGFLNTAADVPSFNGFKTDLAKDPFGEMKNQFWSHLF